MIFDPIFIIYQIIALQCAFYLAMGTFWAVSHIVIDIPFSLDHFFTAQYLNFVSFTGWIEVFCTLLTGLAG
jgi:hypothetical protein